MISTILYGRNDSHGYNLHKRVAISLNCIAHVLDDPNDEIIFVDYNTPDDMPTFVEAISGYTDGQGKIDYSGIARPFQSSREIPEQNASECPGADLPECCIA